MLIPNLKFFRTLLLNFIFWTRNVITAPIRFGDGDKRVTNIDAFPLCFVLVDAAEMFGVAIGGSVPLVLPSQHRLWQRRSWPISIMGSGSGGDARGGSDATDDVYHHDRDEWMHASTDF